MALDAPDLQSGKGDLEVGDALLFALMPDTQRLLLVIENEDDLECRPMRPPGELAIMVGI